MNNDFLKQLKDALNEHRLTPAEKASMRTDLAHFMDTHPTSHAPAASPYMRISWVAIRTPVMALCAVLLIAGGGVSAAARSALPGDLLYGMKVEVNERVETALALSVEAKAETEARQAFRRLDEVEQLSERGALTAERNTALRTRFEEKTEALDKHLATLDTSGKAEVAAGVHTKVEAGLDARFSALVTLSATPTAATTSRPHITNILTTVFERHDAKKIKEDRDASKKGKNGGRGKDSSAPPTAASKPVQANATTTATTSTPAATSTHRDNSNRSKRPGIIERLEDMFKRSDAGPGTLLSTGEAAASAAASVSAPTPITPAPSLGL